MKISSAFPSKYLRADDLPPGRDVLVTVEDVRLESIEDGEEDRPVAYFAGKKKGLVLNKTNATMIAADLGDETETWNGRNIIIFATTTLYKGQRVRCLRVRMPQLPAVAPAPSAPAAPAQPQQPIYPCVPF